MTGQPGRSSLGWRPRSGAGLLWRRLSDVSCPELALSPLCLHVAFVAPTSTAARCRHIGRLWGGGGAICSGKAGQVKDRFRPLSIVRETFSVHCDDPLLPSVCLGQSSAVVCDSASYNAAAFRCGGEGKSELACGWGSGLREPRRRTGSAVVVRPGPDCTLPSTFVFRWPIGSRVRNQQGLSGVVSRSRRRSAHC